MPAQFDDESVWDAFIQDKSLDIEEEQDFLEYLFDQDIDPDEASLKILDDAYVQFVDEEDD